MSQDHIRLLVSIPPQMTVRLFVRLIEGKTSHNLLSEYPHFWKTCRGRHFWARVCFCRSSGNELSSSILKDKIAFLTTISELTVKPERVGEADHARLSVNRSHRLSAGGAFTFDF
ncbi:MAG: transposase [Candidatus Electronema sp. V4]|uniref:transposase n=1 Tax=Candidatus Electronema sp. V4 TaxID=3454756 RepID=UPI0040556C45